MDRFETSSAHALYDVTARIVGREIRMGDTVTFLAEVDLTEVEAIRRTTSRMKPSYTALVLKAAALALARTPYANRRTYRPFGLPFLPLRMQTFRTVDIAVAVERELPGVEVATFIDVIRDVDRIDLDALTGQLRALATCDARDNAQWRSYSRIVERCPRFLAARLIRAPVFIPKLWSRYRGGAMVLSSPCKYGVDAVFGAWMAPLGLSFGLVKQRPVVKDGVVVPCPTFALTLNFDRRVMAGAQAARFFRRIVENLERAHSVMAEFLGPEEQREERRNRTAVPVPV